MALKSADRALAALLVEVCRGTPKDVALAARAARRAGASRALVDEALLIAPLYAGVPRTVVAFTAWREVEPEPAAPVRRPPPAGGPATFRAVYGPRAARVRAELRRLHPAFEASVIGDAYGRVLSRPGLPLRTKELMAVPTLIATDAPRQLASHVLGARRAGASEREILAAAAVAARRVPASRMRASLTLIRRTLRNEAGPR